MATGFRGLMAHTAVALNRMCNLLLLSKSMGELEAFLASLFGLCEKFELVIPWWLENEVTNQDSPSFLLFWEE